MKHHLAKIDLIMVFYAILTGRLFGVRYNSVCMGIQLQITFCKIKFYTIFESQSCQNTTMEDCIHQV